MFCAADGGKNKKWRPRKGGRKDVIIVHHERA
jgi:hypothetical protein